MFRRKGVGIALLEEIEEFSREKGYCKITLEVLDGNSPAKELYKKAGFEGYCLDETFGHAEFWTKKLVER